MALKKPKKPKLASLPKKPKSNASDQAWKGWNDRAKKVQQENNKKITAYNKLVTSYYSALAARDRLKKEVKKFTVKWKE